MLLLIGAWAAEQHRWSVRCVRCVRCVSARTRLDFKDARSRISQVTSCHTRVAGGILPKPAEVPASSGLPSPVRCCNIASAFVGVQTAPCTQHGVSKQAPRATLLLRGEYLLQIAGEQTSTQ